MSIVRYRPLRNDTGAWLLDVETGELIRPLIGAKGNVQMAPPTSSEQALQKANLQLIRKQMEIADQQSRETDALAPYLYRQMGYNYTKDPNTGALSIAKMSDAERRSYMTQEELEQADITALANSRTKKALEGKLDVDPAVESDIARGEQQLRAELMRRLGPGAEGSDSWNRAMQEYNKQMDMVRYSVRHGEMTTADAIATNRQNQSMSRQDQLIQHLKSSTDPRAAAVGTYGAAVGSSEGALARMYGMRADAASLAFQNKQNNNAFTGGIIQGALGLTGAGMGAGAIAY